MAEITDAEVEAVARVICVAHGFDPDEVIPDHRQPSNLGVQAPRWSWMWDTSITAIAAHRAIKAFHQGGGGDTEAGRAFVRSMGPHWYNIAAVSEGALTASILEELDRAGFQIVRKAKP